MRFVTCYIFMNLTREEKLEQLDKVLESRTLQGSESLRAFLRFVVLKSLDNQDGLLKEYTIATEVFGRNSSYDSRSDSIVRVQAGRLRSKLKEYYATEGRGDKVFIELPKGHYAPVFKSAQGTNGYASSEKSVSETPSHISGPRARFDRWSGLIIALLVVLCLVVGTLALIYRSEASNLKKPPNAESADAKAASPLWSDFMRSPGPVVVAFSNTLFQGTAETGMKLLKPLDKPVENFGSPAVPRASSSDGENSSVITEHYTGIGEVMGVHFLSSFFAKANRPFRVKRSLLLTWDDLKASNIVILGSPAENFLLRDLPQKQDFLFQLVKDENQNNVFGLANTNLKEGEQQYYLAKQEGPSRSQISEDYALISLLQGLDAKNRLLILAGVTTFGTQAAAEYVTKPEYIKELIDHLNLTPDRDSPTLPAYFQVVIKVEVKGGVPVQVSYVTHHVL